MSSESTPFTKPVRTTPTCPFDRCIPTVEAAIDALIYDLPEAKSGLPHWRRAHDLLYAVYDAPRDLVKLEAAEVAFRDALQAEQWLRGVPPSFD